MNRLKLFDKSIFETEITNTYAIYACVSRRTTEYQRQSNWLIDANEEIIYEQVEEKVEKKISNEQIAKAIERIFNARV